MNEGHETLPALSMDHIDTDGPIKMHITVLHIALHQSVCCIRSGKHNQRTALPAYLNNIFSVCYYHIHRHDRRPIHPYSGYDCESQVDDC